MNFRIKINAFHIAILLAGITFILAMNAASAHTPNDTYWSNQWGPGNIYALQAWDIQKGSTNVTIAILDTGIDYNHEDLAGRVIQGWNFANNSSEVMDDNSGSHGTHVAGIAGAIMDNSKGIAGISQSELLVIKACNFMGMCSWSSIIDSIYYAANNNANIISMSLGKEDYDPDAENAVNYAYSKGALLISCAGETYLGNGIEFIEYPGAFDNVTAIGATESNDTLAYFSYYGSKLELVAPGVNIYSTKRNNGYGYQDGCSMSVPYVSGVAALVWSQYPALSNTEVRQILTITADDLGSPGRDIYYGYGKVNAHRALSYLPGGWDSRKQKTINGTSVGAQTNYQMQLTVYKGSGTDTPGVVYLGGNVRDDFGDLRFTKSEGVTLLDYWIESYTSGVSAVVWVEVDSIPASTADIYIYYGNPSATSASSADNTLEFFEDFNGNLGRWVYSGTSIVDGHAEIAASGSDWGNYMYSARSFDRNTSGYLLEVWVAVNGRTYNYNEVMVGFGSTSIGPARPREAWYHWGNTNDNSMYTMDAGYAPISCCGMPPIGEFRRYSVYIYKTSGGLLTADFHSSQPVLTGADSGMRIKIQPYKGGAKVSIVMARKYANPEPSWEA